MKKIASFFCYGLVIAGLSLTQTAQAQSGDTLTQILQVLRSIYGSVSPQLNNNLTSSLSAINTTNVGVLTTLNKNILPAINSISQSINNNQAAAPQTISNQSAQFVLLNKYNDAQSYLTSQIQASLTNTIFGSAQQPLNMYQRNYTLAQSQAQFCDNLNRCYSPYTIQAIKNADTITGKGAQDAALAYTTYIAGGALNINPPDPKWKANTQDVINYVNMFRTMQAVQSIQIQNAAHRLAERMPTNVQKANDQSAYSFSKNTNYLSLISSDTQTALMKLPVFSWIFSIQQNLTSLVVIAQKQLDALNDITDLLGAANLIQMQMFSATTGVQMYNAAQSASGSSKN